MTVMLWKTGFTVNPSAEVWTLILTFPVLTCCYVSLRRNSGGSSSAIGFLPQRVEPFVNFKSLTATHLLIALTGEPLATQSFANNLNSGEAVNDK